MNPRLAKEDRKSPLTFFLLLSVTLFLCVAVFGPDGPVRTRGSNSIEIISPAVGERKTSSSAKFKTMMRTKKNEVKEEEEEENNNNASESEYAQINAYFAKFAVKRDEDKKEESSESRSRRRKQRSVVARRNENHLRVREVLGQTSTHGQ